MWPNQTKIKEVPRKLQEENRTESKLSSTAVNVVLNGDQMC